MKTIIIGAGTGGLFSGLTIKKHMRDAEVVYYDQKDFELLHPCGIPYVIEGKVESFDELKDTLPDMGFVKHLRHQVKGMDIEKKTIYTVNLDTGEEVTDNYDKLIIATGSTAFVPPVPGAKELLGKGVHKVDSFENSFALSEHAKKAKKAAIIGAGAIGLESAVAMKEKGLEVTVVEMAPCALFKSIDPDISKILEDYMTKKGIRLLFNTKLEKINGTDHVESITANGETVECDLVVLAAGVRPSIDFVHSDIERGKWGLMTNERMQTNFPDIYAVGDCVQLKSRIDQRDWMMQLAVAAYKQGIVAGMNIVGVEKIYKGALTTFASKIGDMEVAATGFNQACIECEHISAKATGLTKPKWCQGGTELTVKLIADKKGRLIGGQAIGKNGAGHRIDVVSTAIQAGFTAYELSETELTYCPAMSETYDVLMQAADQIIRRIK